MVAARYAKNDAIVFNDFAHRALGVPLQNIKILTNEDAERTDTLKALTQWLPKIVEENNTDFFLFFSGHGLGSADGKDKFLMPADGDTQLLTESTLLQSKIFNDIA